MVELENMPPDFVKTFSHHLQIYAFSGLHVFDNTQRGKGKNIRFIVLSIYYITMTLSQIVFVCMGPQDDADLLAIFLAFPCAVVFSLDVIKMYIIAMKKRQIRELLGGIAELWPLDLSHEPEKLNEMKTRTQRTKIYDNIFLYGLIVSLFIFHALPISVTFHNLLNSKPIFVSSLQVYYPWTINSLGRYLFSYGLTIVFGVLIYVCIGLNTELFLIALLSNLSILFRLLQIDLENVITSNEDEDIEDRREREIVHLKEIIRRHQKLLGLSDKINDIYGMIVFMTTSSSAILICFFGFLTVVSEGTYVFMYVVGLFGMVTSILNFSWPGQLLYDASSGISDAAYSCLWYDRGPKVRKLISIIIHRSQKPCYLSALGLSNMSYLSLVKVFNTSLSYLSLLRQLYAQDV